MLRIYKAAKHEIQMKEDNRKGYGTSKSISCSFVLGIGLFPFFEFQLV